MRQRALLSLRQTPKRTGKEAGARFLRQPAQILLIEEYGEARLGSPLGKKVLHAGSIPPPRMGLGSCKEGGVGFGGGGGGGCLGGGSMGGVKKGNKIGYATFASQRTSDSVHLRRVGRKEKRV